MTTREELIEKVRNINPESLNEQDELRSFLEQYGIYSYLRDMKLNKEPNISHFVLALDGSAFGVPALSGKPLVLSRKTLKHITNKHNIALNQIERLSTLLGTNLLAFEDPKYADKYIFVLDEQLKNRHYIGVVRVNLNLEGIEVDQVRSLFAKNDLDGLISMALDKGKEFYFNERTGTWIDSLGNRDNTDFAVLSHETIKRLLDIY